MRLSRYQARSLPITRAKTEAEDRRSVIVRPRAIVMGTWPVVSIRIRIRSPVRPDIAVMAVTAVMPPLCAHIGRVRRARRFDIGRHAALCLCRRVGLRRRCKSRTEVRQRCGDCRCTKIFHGEHLLTRCRLRIQTPRNGGSFQRSQNRTAVRSNRDPAQTDKSSERADNKAGSGLAVRLHRAATDGREDGSSDGS